MRAPRRGCPAANSSRMAIKPGISVSAMAISLRPKSAKEISAIAQRVATKLFKSVTVFINAPANNDPMLE